MTFFSASRRAMLVPSVRDSVTKRRVSTFEFNPHEGRVIRRVSTSRR